MAGLLEALRPVLVLVLGVLLELFQQRAQPTCEDSAVNYKLRDKLRTKVRKHWIILLVVLLLPGCGTRTIYIPHGEPVRLRETIHNAKVWVLNENGKPVAGRMDLMEGWYCLDVSEDEDKEP